MLLSCTLFGLAMMHTLGHAGPRAMTHHQLAAAVGVAADGVHDSPALSVLVPPALASAAFVPSTMASGHCSGDHCDGHGSGGMSGWSVCLAVLSGLIALVLLVALLSWMVAGRGRTRGKHAGRSPVPRGPPRRMAGLALVSVAVLRI